MISARKVKHLDVTTMFTYSHANTPLGPSEPAYYLSYFIMIHIKYVVFMSLWPHSSRILISNWPRRGGRGRPFLSMVTHWSRSTSSFYALIGQNLTGEFMRKLYATSWKLFSLTAEADRVLCQLLIFLTVFFLWMYKMKYSCYQESSVIHGWFVYWVFGWEMRRLSKFGSSFLDGIVFVFHLA